MTFAANAMLHPTDTRKRNHRAVAPALLALPLAGFVWLAPYARTPRAHAEALAALVAACTVVLHAWLSVRVPAHALRLLFFPCGVLAALKVAAAPADSTLAFALINASVLTAGSLLGGYLGGLITQPAMLTVTAYVASLGDLFSVVHPNGLTAHVAKRPEALRFLALSVPLLGTDETVAVVGVGDFVFATMFVVGSRTAGLPVSRTLAGLSLGLLGVVCAVAWFELTLPAIPFLALGVVLAQRDAWRLPPGQERRVLLNLAGATLILGSLLVASLIRS